jgi:hypothetical protein
MSFHALTGCCTPFSRIVMTSVTAVALPWNARLKNSPAKAVAGAGLLQ